MMLRLQLLLVVMTINVVTGCLSSGASGCCCGQPACRARARGATIQKVDASEVLEELPETTVLVDGLQIWDTDVTNMDNSTRWAMANPNNIFRDCCSARNLPPACVSKCNYNQYNRQTLLSMYLNTDKCPIQFASEMHFCAAQGTDHRDCCARNGVSTTLAGPKCLAFCDQTPDKFTRLDFTYAPCYERFENMKQCFFEKIKMRAEKKFIWSMESVRV